jgi:hypothetical protein
MSDLLDEAPVIGAMAAEPTDGDTHKYLKQTGAPTVGFRAVNAGRENTKSADTEVTVTLKLLDCSVAVDQALADQYRFGPAAYVAREALRHLRAGFFHAENAFINGTGFDAASFNGLKDDAQLNAVADTMVHNAAGAIADEQASVWAIRTGADARDAMLVSGMDGQIKVGETISQFIDVSGGRMPVYATPIFAWLGMQIGGAFSVARLANLDSGPTAPVVELNDDLISELLSLFPAGRGPTFLAMNRTSRKQLQQSRTATTTSGAPAPFPIESFGVPIITSEAIGTTDAVLV